MLTILRMLISGRKGRLITEQEIQEAGHLCLFTFPSNQVHTAFFSFLIQFYVPFKIISAHISGWYENGRSTRKTIWQTASRRSRTVIKGTPLSLTQFTPSKPCTRLPYIGPCLFASETPLISIAISLQAVLWLMPT